MPAIPVSLMPKVAGMARSYGKRRNSWRGLQPRYGATI